MTGRPASWAVGSVVGAGAVSIVIVGSRSVRRLAATGPVETEDPSCWKGLREFPYLAGGPARIWHLADSTPVGCRGFIGPVPPPLLIRALQLCGDRTGRRRGVSTRPKVPVSRVGAWFRRNARSIRHRRIHLRSGRTSRCFHSCGTTMRMRPTATRPSCSSRLESTGSAGLRGSRRSPGRSRFGTFSLPDQGARAFQPRGRGYPSQAGLRDCSASLEASARVAVKRRTVRPRARISRRSGAGARPERGHGRGTARRRVAARPAPRPTARSVADVMYRSRRSGPPKTPLVTWVGGHADDDIELAVWPVAADLPGVPERDPQAALGIDRHPVRLGNAVVERRDRAGARRWRPSPGRSRTRRRGAAASRCSRTCRRPRSRPCRSRSTASRAGGAPNRPLRPNRASQSAE